jgi:nicotinamidase-related amidase
MSTSPDSPRKRAWARASEPARNPDLHGNVPDSSPVALLLIDVINDMEYEGGEKLLEHALPMSTRLAALKKRAHEAGIPAIYVNDNFGRWRSDFHAQVNHCLSDGVRGEPVVRRLSPEPDDYSILKPKHSGFYSTTLDTLLDYLGARTLILTGLAGDSCVLFTANDAFMRDFRIVVPADCTASQHEEWNRRALDHMRDVLDAEIAGSTELDLKRLMEESSAK